MSKKQRKVCKTLNYIEHFLILACVSTFAFASLVRIRIGISSSAKGLKICAITAETKKYKSIIQKKKKKHDKIALLPKSKLNSIDVLIFTALIDLVLVFTHNKFVLINNV